MSYDPIEQLFEQLKALEARQRAREEFLCAKCEGRGKVICRCKIPAHEKKCPECDGKGLNEEKVKMALIFFHGY